MKRTQNTYDFVLNKHKNQYGEYKIICFKNGLYYEDGSYYTDDWKDALITLDNIRANALKITKKIKVLKSKEKDYYQVIYKIMEAE